jgi:hypothetical protein
MTELPANIGAIDADVIELVIRIAGELLKYVPVDPASPQEAASENIFMTISFV